MIELKRPMLAAPTKVEQLRAVKWPMLASVKIDGIRALCRHNPTTGVPEIVSRRLIAIPNEFIQSRYGREEFVGMDGELMVGAWTDKNVYNKTNSGVMAASGVPDVQWAVFDKWDHDAPYALRAMAAKIICEKDSSKSLGVRWLPQRRVDSFEQMEQMEEVALHEGYEGLMLRSATGPYKQNRSTVKQQFLLKVKRFAEGEAEILGCVEQMYNANEATKDELGYTKRSSHKENKVGKGVLGAFSLRDIDSGVEFDMGTGFTDEQRLNLWEERNYIIGKVVRYRHFPIGVKEKPRFPTFAGFRDMRDR